MFLLTRFIVILFLPTIMRTCFSQKMKTREQGSGSNLTGQDTKAS